MPRWLYYLLILAVVAPLLQIFGASQYVTVIFIFSTLSLIPLAALISRTTEDLAYYVGPIAGGLLNATFGNAPEIIIGIFALQRGLIFVVKASISGSIIGNVLLVLGGSLAVGGWRWGRQYFSTRDAGQYSAMMVLSVAGLVIPFAAGLAIPDADRRESLSIGIAIILLIVYVMYLALNIFHVRAERRNPRTRRITVPLPVRTVAGGAKDADEDEVEPTSGGADPQELDEAAPTHLGLKVLFLLIATIATGWNSELLVGTIEPVAAQFGWSPTFIGLVIIPLVGNAAEHSSAIVVAYRDRVELSVAIAAGSSIQVATFVAPILVLVSLFYPQHLDLLFTPLELVLLGLATALFRFVCSDGETTWLAGMQLLAVYVMACIVFFLLPG